VNDGGAAHRKFLLGLEDDDPAGLKSGSSRAPSRGSMEESPEPKEGARSPRGHSTDKWADARKRLRLASEEPTVLGLTGAGLGDDSKAAQSKADAVNDGALRNSPRRVLSHRTVLKDDDERVVEVKLVAQALASVPAVELR